VAKEPNRTVTLRAVADMLVERGYSSRRDKNGFNKLLELLKCGDLRTVVFFPIVSKSPVPVPVEYWIPRGPDALQTLLKVPKRNWQGAYNIKLRELAASVFRVASSSGALDLEDLVKVLVEHAEMEANVEVLESEWQKYASLHPPGTGSRLAGRPEKNWEAVYAELAALLWQAIDRKQPVDHESLARQIAEHLQALNAENPPTWKTIKGKLSSVVRSRVDALQAKSK
jgi:hypothetical protein